MGLGERVGAAHGMILRTRGSSLVRAGSLAQLAEQGTFNPKVEGSTPSRPTTKISPRLRKCGRGALRGDTCHSVLLGASPRVANSLVGIVLPHPRGSVSHGLGSAHLWK